MTGTDGKSTVVALAAEMLWGCRWHPGQIGTVQIGIFDEIVPNDDRNTTPEALELQELLARMVDAGNDSVVMEATSHALALGRTRNCRFDVARGDDGDERAPRVPRDRRGVPRGQGAPGRGGADRGPERRRFELRATSESARPIGSSRMPSTARRDLRAGNLRPDPSGTTFHLESPRWHGEVRVAMPGRFNVSNALAALGVVEALGLDVHHASMALETTAGVPGRMEGIDAGQPFVVVVDYAHTADALAKVLDELALVVRPAAARWSQSSARPATETASKRPAMGRARPQPAVDLAVLTDEDPRTEDRQAILEAIAIGARGGRSAPWARPVPRTRPNIGDPLGHRPDARRGDVILLAGKGHETSIFYGTDKRPWDDRVGRCARRWPRRGGGAPVAELRAWRVTDPDAWNAFVEATPYHAFTRGRSGSGARCARWAVGGRCGWRSDPRRTSPSRGARLLLRQIPLLGWHLAYAPRGPVGRLDDPGIRNSLVARPPNARPGGADRDRPRRSRGRALDAVRAGAAGCPVALGAEGAAADDARHRPDVRRRGTLDDLKRKHRQYVNKADGRRDDRALRRLDASRGHRSGARGLQPDLSDGG